MTAEELKESEMAAENAAENTAEAPENAADTADVTPEAMIAALSAELARTREELNNEKDAHLRLQAEFVNFRKRKEKEASDSIRFANADMAKTLLPLLDDFERTLSVIEKTDNLAAIKEGIEMVNKNFVRIFGKIGVQAIEDPKGKPFDSNLHEVITTVSLPDQADIVIDVVEKGYVYHDKVIRFTKVVVAE